MTTLTPTLGDLRERLRKEGKPGPSEEFIFDLSDDVRLDCSCPNAKPERISDPVGFEEWKCATCGKFARLPDCWVVHHPTYEWVLEGAYDHLSDQTPLQELEI